MSALFPPWTNTLSKATLLCALLAVTSFFTFLLIWVRSPLFTHQDAVEEQPLQFDHRHHTRDDGIDCRYCHNTVDKSPSAGIPPTQLCLNCHSQIWNKSPLPRAGARRASSRTSRSSGGASTSFPSSSTSTTPST